LGNAVPHECSTGNTFFFKFRLRLHFIDYAQLWIFSIMKNLVFYRNKQGCRVIHRRLYAAADAAGQRTGGYPINKKPSGRTERFLLL
jgi:hypothetical protein